LGINSIYLNNPYILPGIEQSGFCNILKKIEINIPANIKNVKIFNQYNKLNVSIKKIKKI
tara:strand:+ start:399 stop:578 length:180 start_codon:yes stop_codon:yes gene_type:complete